MSFKKDKPKVSIVCASYNHEKYVANFIQSILNQTYQNFELIIIDDASNDNNLKIINSFKDSRIKLIKHEFNQGPSTTFNDGIKISSGDYIAFMASDDEAKPDYLEKGVEFLQKNQKYQAVCFQLEGIDENGKIINDSDLQRTLKFINIPYHQLLNQMFTLGNMLPSPGEIIKKSIIDKIGTYNPALIQSIDYDFHIRTLLKSEVYVYSKPLIRYRHAQNGKNIDNKSNNSKLRLDLEIPIVLENFLNIDFDLFNKVFSEEIKTIGKPTKETVTYFLARILLNTSDPIRQKWGYQTLLKYIENPKNLQLLFSLYSIQYKDIISLSNQIGQKNKVYKILKLIKNKYF